MQFVCVSSICSTKSCKRASGVVSRGAFCFRRVIYWGIRRKTSKAAVVALSLCCVFTEREDNFSLFDVGWVRARRISTVSAWKFMATIVEVFIVRIISLDTISV